MKVVAPKPFEVRSFIAKYRTKAIKDGRSTDIHSLLRMDKRYFIVDDKSEPADRQSAADLKAFGAFDREYRYEDPLLGPRTLFIYKEAAAERLYMRVETQARGKAEVAFCPMKVRSDPGEGGRWKMSILPHGFMREMDKNMQIFLIQLAMQEYPYQGDESAERYDERKLDLIQRQERMEAQKKERELRRYDHRKQVARGI